MPGINSTSSLLNVSTFAGANTDLAIKPTSKGGQDLKLEFDPVELGFPDPRKRPSELRLTDRQIERQTLKQLGLDLKSSENLALVNKRLDTHNPFQALNTSGSNLATYNADTGKYEMKLKIDSNLFAKLKGWAANTKADIAAAKQEKTNQITETAAPQTILNNPSAPPTIKVFVPLVEAEGDQSLGESALLSYVSDRYSEAKTGLYGDSAINIRNNAINAGVRAIKPEQTPVGNKTWVRLEIKVTDAKKIDNIFKAERSEVNRQSDVMTQTARDSVGNKFAEGFVRGALNDLKGNAEMVYGAASDPLGTAWKVGEAIVHITALPTTIGNGIGQAAVELSQLSPTERQGLVDELIAKGHTDLANMPVSVAAEKAGEIVGTIAMEVILGKGASVGLKALKGTALAAKIEVLAQTAKATIAEVKVPVKVTAQVLADTAGGTRPIINVETKKLGDLIAGMEARAKQALSGGDEVARVKPIGLPTWDKLTIRLEADGTPHLISNHKIDGKGYVQSLKNGGDKDPFPASMTEKQIINAVKKAYGNAQKVEVQTRSNGEKVFVLLGKSEGLKIKMYVNATTKELETAFPQYGGK